MTTSKSGEAAHAASPKIFSDVEGRKPSRKRKFLRLSLLCLAVCAGTWGVVNNPWLQERRYPGMTLAQLEKARGNRMDDPALLYFQGRRLNEVGRFKDADPLLRQAVALEPALEVYRDEWTKALLGSGLTTAAFGQLKQFVGTYPNSPSSHFLLGKFYVTQHSLLRASEELQKTVSLDPKHGEAWRFLALAEMGLGNRDAARKAITNAVALRPEDAEAYRLRAGLQALSGENAEARQSYETAIRLNPKEPSAEREYAVFLLRVGSTQDDLKRAEIAAAAAVQKDAKDGIAQLTLGQAIARQNRPAESLVYLKNSVQLLSLLPLPAKELADAYRTLGKPDEESQWRQKQLEWQKDDDAKKVIYEKLRINPNDRALHRQMALLLAKQGDVEGCVRNFAAAQGCALDAPPALIAASDALTASHHADLALPLAQRATRITVSNSDAQQALGNALLELGKVNEAAEQYNKAAEWIPSRYAGYKAKILAYRRDHPAQVSPAESAYLKANQEFMGQFGPHRATDTLEASARQAVSLEPNNSEYLRLLIDVMMLKRDRSEVLPFAKRLATLQPDDAPSQLQLALQLVERETRPEAITEAQTLLNSTANKKNLSPSTLSLWHYIAGAIALKQNKGMEAVSELKQSLAYEKADSTYFKLAQAERLAGNAKGANEATRLFTERTDALAQEAQILGQLREQPDVPSLYARAVTLFRLHGKQEQSEAIRLEAVRRFGQKSSTDAKKSGVSR